MSLKYGGMEINASERKCFVCGRFCRYVEGLLMYCVRCDVEFAPLPCWSHDLDKTYDRTYDVYYIDHAVNRTVYLA
jgi:hypothetical protein